MIKNLKIEKHDQKDANVSLTEGKILYQTFLEDKHKDKHFLNLNVYAHIGRNEKTWRKTNL